MACGTCGKPLDVPKLRDLRRLPPVEDSPSTGPGSWGAVQGALFVLGLLAMVIAAGSAYYNWSLLHQLDTTKPDLPKFKYELDNIPLMDSWKLWKDYRDIDVETRVTPYYLRAQEKAAELDRWISLFALIGGVGAACVLGSLISSVFSKPSGR